MGKFKTWKEYLDGMGKVVENPPTEEVPDYKGPDPKSPEKAVTKGKNWDAKAAKSDAPAPYRASGKDPGQQKGEKGFADEGDKNLVYKPDTTVKKKSKTEQFLDKTKNMTLAEFTQHMIEECGCGAMKEDDDLPTVTAYTSGKFHPHPPEAIRYVVVLANKNDRILESLIHELKRTGGLTGFMEALMDHPESYNSLCDLLSHDEHGPTRAKKLVRTMDDSYNSFLKNQEDMYESVAPPFGTDVEDAEDDDSETEVDDVESGDELGTNAAPDLDLDLGSDEEMGKTNNDDETENDVPSQSDEAMPVARSKNLKKRFAEDHLLDAMSGHERIVSKMKKYMPF
jgi:hypothetical protein